MRMMEISRKKIWNQKNRKMSNALIDVNVYENFNAVKRHDPQQK